MATASVGSPEALDRYRALLDGAMKALVPAEPKGLYAMLRYHLGWADQEGREVEGGSVGKALRPTLCFLTCEALGCPGTRAATAAATLELIHNFSLIHDDIQDGDRERHGMPAVWAVWGTHQALWAGNAMRAIADRGLALDGVPHDRRGKAVRLLTNACLEMIQGQYLDMEFEGRSGVSVEDYLGMIARKTGALIRCAVELGALVAGVEGDKGAALRQWGTHVGRAFQVRDDILGIWGDPVLTGKPVGNDLRRKKKSFPVVFAFEHATGVARGVLERSFRLPVLEDAQVDKVLGVMEGMEVYRQSQALVDRETEEATAALGKVAGALSPWAGEQMVQLTRFLAHRGK